MNTLVIDGWKKNIRFSSAHFIPGHEKCSRLHGHTYALFLKIEADALPRSGMIMDFSLLQHCLHALADELDHKILLPSKHSGVKQQGSSIHVDFAEKHYVFPTQDCKLLPLPVISAEQLAQYCLDQVNENVTFPECVTKVSVGVDEGFGTCAYACLKRR